jgi:hypothetical protein
VEDVIWEQTGDGNWTVDEPEAIPWTYAALVERYKINLKIYSVKRLSDGVEFKIDDFAKLKPNLNGKQVEGRIAYFKVDNDYGIEVGFKEVRNAGNWNYLQNLIKVEKLFTTEDGVDIYEGDRYYRIDIHRNSWTPQELSTKRAYDNKPNAAYFSTREAAIEYIILNKPLASLQNLLDIYKSFYGRIDSSFVSFVRKFVRNKLNLK